MAKYGVTVGGLNYEVDAPDETTAWKWANQTHLQAIKNDPQQAPMQAIPKGLETAAQVGTPRNYDQELRDQTNLEQVPYELGAKVNDAAAKVLPPEFAAGLGTVANAGMQALPMAVGATTGVAVGRPLMRAGAEHLMHSALKPGVQSLRSGGPERAVNTMLDEGLNVSRGGVEKAEGIVSNLNDEIATLIRGSNATIDTRAAASRLADALRRFRAQVNPNADVAAIRGSRAEFMAHPDIGGAPDIPVQLAQALKQGTNRVLAGKYGEQGSAITEAQKALVRGLKEEIATAVPAISGLNARESALLATLPALERRVLVEGNRNPGGLSFLSTNPAAAAAFMADKSSLFKSLLARMMNANKETIPATVGAALPAYMMNEEPQ